MKYFWLLLFGGVIALTTVAAELVITSFNPNGELTWTNSVSNATYRVEWAGSATGPWTNFDALTNLTLLSATNNSVTVEVPMFYRVVWSDAPAYAGTYELREYDLEGSLVVTGRLYLSGTGASFRGTKDLRPVGNYSTNDIGPQLGAGTVGGAFGGSYPYMTLGLDPGFNDNNVNLSGYLVGNTYLGSWAWTMFTAIPLAQGTFTATKLNEAGSLTPPDPVATWDYEVVWPAALLAKGQLTFATGTNPVAGSWLFNPWDSSLPTEHLLGQGSFTNAIISGNSISISLPSAGGTFTLAGQMSGEFYAGFCEWTGVAGPGKGRFIAKRRISP